MSQKSDSGDQHLPLLRNCLSKNPFLEMRGTPNCPRIKPQQLCKTLIDLSKKQLRRMELGTAAPDTPGPGLSRRPPSRKPMLRRNSSKNNVRYKAKPQPVFVPGIPIRPNDTTSWHVHPSSAHEHLTRRIVAMNTSLIFAARFSPHVFHHNDWMQKNEMKTTDLPTLLRTFPFRSGVIIMLLKLLFSRGR